MGTAQRRGHRASGCPNVPVPTSVLHQHAQSSSTVPGRSWDSVPLCAAGELRGHTCEQVHSHPSGQSPEKPAGSGALWGRGARMRQSDLCGGSEARPRANSVGGGTRKGPLGEPVLLGKRTEACASVCRRRGTGHPPGLVAARKTTQACVYGGLMRHGLWQERPVGGHHP